MSDTDSLKEVVLDASLNSKLSNGMSMWLVAVAILYLADKIADAITNAKSPLRFIDSKDKEYQ